MNKTFKIPSYVRANITSNSYVEADHTIEIVFATEFEAKRQMWDGTKYIEKLICTTDSVRLERANNGANLIDTHSTYSVNSIYGVVKRAWVENNECRAIIKLSKRKEVEGIVGDIIDGVITNVSVGYRIHETTVTENEETNVYSVRVDVWEPGEISVCSMPVDHVAGVRSEEPQEPVQNYHEITFTQNTRTMTPEEIAAAAAEQQRAAGTITQPTIPTPAVATPIDSTAVRTEATTAERSRISQINTAVRAAGIEDQPFIDGLINGGQSADAARSAIIDRLAEGQVPAARTQTSVRIGVEAIEVKREAMMNAIMHRADPSVALTEAAREYRGLTLMDMARESVEAAGGKTRGMSRMDIAQASLNLRSEGMHSTSDFPLILGNTVNRSLRDEYALQQRTFTSWATRGSVRDFKETTRLSLGEVGDFKEVKEGGEYEYATLGEGAEKLKIVKYGQLIAITWEALINDDLDAFSRIPRKIANAAARKQSDLVYGILTSNPNMADGVPLFHATHKNLATGSVIDSTNLGLMRKLFRKQTGIGGKDVLDLSPKFILVGPDQEEAAIQYTTSNFVPTEANKQNVWAGIVKPVVENRITGNQWFFAADPAHIDTIEYFFMEGQPELFTEQRNGFDVDGLEIKARMLFGAKAIDFRGLAKNPGQ